MMEGEAAWDLISASTPSDVGIERRPLCVSLGSKWGPESTRTSSHNRRVFSPASSEMEGLLPFEEEWEEKPALLYPILL